MGYSLQELLEEAVFMTKIWAHSIVKNEEKYIWFSIMSVIDFVDKILVWDTGSTDQTTEILSSIIEKYPSKVIFEQHDSVDIDKFTQKRQEMLDKTKSDWILILDGDEVWWKDSIAKLTSLIRSEGKKLDTIVTPFFNIVGDIFHYQKESAGKYELDNRRGHITIRAVSRKIPGLHLEKPHGTQGFFDGNGKLIQERSSKKRIFLDAPFMHFTHVLRSSGKGNDDLVPKRKRKFKYELGKSFPLDFYYPEVFFIRRPEDIPSPWVISGVNYKLVAAFQNPFKFFKRKLFHGGVGY